MGENGTGPKLCTVGKGVGDFTGTNVGITLIGGCFVGTKDPNGSVVGGSVGKAGIATGDKVGNIVTGAGVTSRDSCV